MNIEHLFAAANSKISEAITAFTRTGALLGHAGPHIKIALRATALGWTPNSLLMLSSAVCCSTAENGAPC
jgi:hypothetical protein